MPLNNKEKLASFYTKAATELNDILAYWSSHTQDPVHGGFIGRIDENNKPDSDSPKGVVLNARILWTFSAAYKITRKPDLLHLARMAFSYFSANFIDQEYGGVYWSITVEGKPLDTKKQIYALAFAIYACAEYFDISQNDTARTTAIELYALIEKYSFDKTNCGYLEAFTREWQSLTDLRLSDKDANEKKTMNTHLHVLEAYTVLYRIWPDEQLAMQIKRLIENFIAHMVDATSGHLAPFFDEHWNRKSDTVSYGHDIEAAWLLLEAAEAVNDTDVIRQVKEISVKIVVAAAEGLDVDGGLWYEYEPRAKHLVKEKHWWVQAEAMVGFFNHWQLTNDESFLEKSLQSWQYIQTFIKDKKYGEWYWGRNEDGTVMQGQDKVGVWKCPYHNSRACIEILKRLKPFLKE